MDWRVGLTAGLLALAIVFGWSAWNRRDTNTASAANADTRPDYVMRDFELTRLNEDGSESLTLRAPLLERHPGDQTMNLQAPLFLLPGAEDHPWQLRADTGWLSAKGDELRLNGNVVGDNPEGSATPTRFETQQLNVYPHRHLASSDAKVVITRPGSILSGVGFEANTQTERYILKSQVVSRYAPPSRR